MRMYYHHSEEQQLSSNEKCISKHTDWEKRRKCLSAFCVEKRCITRNEEFQFVRLTKALLKTTSKTIFYMKKVDLNES